MDREARQRQLEVTSVTRGVERYMRTLAKDKEKDRELDTTVGQRLVRKMMAAMGPAVVQLQKDARKRLVEAQTTGRRLGGWEMAIAASDPVKLAYITIRSALNNDNSRGSPKHQLARRIGRIANLELRWAELREQEAGRAKDDPPNRLALMKQRVKEINPRSVRKWLRSMGDLTTEEWSAEAHLKVGFVLMEVFRDTCGDFVDVKVEPATNNGIKRSLIRITLKPEIKKEVDGEHQRRAEDAPWFLPMLCPPRHWKWDGDKFVGGYLTHNMGLIKSHGQTHTAEIVREDTVPQVCRDALAAIDNTGWRVNGGVLDVAVKAEKQELVEVLPVEPVRPLPPELPSDVWAKMTKEERGREKRKRRIIHDHNNRLEAKREAMRRTLRVAEEFAGEEVVYFPHSLDFRGRAYPLPQDLHPQGDDLARGLLTFARAEVLGQEGLAWLCYHAAATYGEDKISRDGQVQWVIDHLDDIASVARDPIGIGYEFWSKAEEPWQFLAVAIELEQAFNHPEGPEAFASSLPVFVDGSCNGLQHLSAMGLDPVGAHATNLTMDPERQDIYQIVADKVASQVYMDAADHLDDASDPSRVWLGRVDRKVVKRGVMTTPYGLTNIGMRDQLINDRWTEGLGGDPMKNAAYLRDLMKEAISGTVVKATEIMGWMQDNAHILATNGRPVDWTAPSGFRVRQAYYNMSVKRVQTLLGRTYVWASKGDPTLNLRKQVLSIAPNIIHSFDAAHMTLSIQAAAADGIRDFAVVHDSFGCHARYMDRFLYHIRAEFVLIYRQDWFGSLQREFQAAVGPDVPLIQPPERGDFDIEQVRDAQYFFA